jgi:hypothetical protein
MPSGYIYISSQSCKALFETPCTIYVIYFIFVFLLTKLNERPHAVRDGVLGGGESDEAVMG